MLRLQEGEDHPVTRLPPQRLVWWLHRLRRIQSLQSRVRSLPRCLDHCHPPTRRLRDGESSHRNCFSAGRLLLPPWLRLTHLMVGTMMIHDRLVISFPGKRHQNLALDSFHCHTRGLRPAAEPFLSEAAKDSSVAMTPFSRN